MDNFTSLWVQVTNDEGAALNIKKRTAVACVSSTGSRRSDAQENISRKTKATTQLPSVLLYCCGTRTTKEKETKLHIFQAKCL